MPSRFKCGRLFAELGARGPESWEEYMSGAPCSCFVPLAVFRRLLLQHRSPSFSRCACLAVVSVLLTTLASFTSFLVLRLFLRPHPYPPQKRAVHVLAQRSEEHTSELQSHVNLVCR